MTPSQRKRMSLKKFKQLIEEVAAAHPRTKNPELTNSLGGTGGCAYSVKTGRGVRHCIVGQFLAEVDPDGLPDINSVENQAGADSVLRSLGYSPDVAILADMVQNFADGFDPWPTAVRKGIAEYEAR